MIRKYEKKNQVKTKLHKFYTPNRGKNQFKIISKKKKIEDSINSLSKENQNNFKIALNKHSFDSEVFIPKTISINKNEYKTKNYLLNNLVSFETKYRERKRYVAPLRKETDRFSNQYKFIREENLKHQKNYLKNLINHYDEIGYNINNIVYKKDENIFSPSSILDHNFGIDIQEDVSKFSSTDFKKDFHKDKKLVKKWQKGVKETRENRSRIKKIKEENEMRGIVDEEIKEKEKEREFKASILQKEVEKIKNYLVEENKIKNMSKEEYFHYNRRIKNDIQIIKTLLEEFNEPKNNSYFNATNSFSICDLDNKRVSRTYKILHPSEPKNYKEKIFFSVQNLSNKEKGKIKKVRNKEFKKTYLIPKFEIQKSNTESPIYIKDNNLFISTESKINKLKDEKDSLPKLLTMLNKEEDDMKTYKKIDVKREIKTEKNVKKLMQKDELDNLYSLVNNNKTNILDQYPSRSVESYFRKYTNKRIPVLNLKKGSNIHGLLEEFQQIVKKKDFYKIAESSNYVKREFIEKKRLSFNKIKEAKTFDIDKIQELDDKIPDLHYILAETLLTNKAKNNNKKI